MSLYVLKIFIKMRKIREEIYNKSRQLFDEL